MKLPVVSRTGATRTDEKTYEVTGTLNPDSTGTYEDAGEHNGKRYYQRAGNGWFIWWDNIAAWWISTVLGVKGASYWGRTDPDIAGPYSAFGGASGEATVTEI